MAPNSFAKFKVSKKYRKKTSLLRDFIRAKNPFSFVEKLFGLKAIEKAEIVHKPLKLGANFVLPNKILIDFNNSIEYCALALAHEYSHLLLRHYMRLEYSLEQGLAIVAQVLYEDYAGIQELDLKRIASLMKTMDVPAETSRKLIGNIRDFEISSDPQIFRQYCKR